MKIHLIAFGKLKNPGFRETADYLIRNVQPWVKLEEHEIKPLEIPDKSEATRKQIQAREAELFLEQLKKIITPRGVICLLDEAGKSQDTQASARQLRSFEDESFSEVVFGVGSSLGWEPALKKNSSGHTPKILSFGPQTLSHELARIILLEQIYRALSVVRGHPYHNQG